MMERTPTLPIASITVKEGRGRKNFDPDKLIELKNSIEKAGIIQPLVVTEEEGKIVLIAGERRYRASMMAGMKEVPVVWKDKLSVLQQRIMELEENIGREDLQWSEKCFLMDQIHELHQKEHGIGGRGSSEGWTIAQTAKVVGESADHVGKQISMAKKLKAKPELAAILSKLPLAAALQKLEQLETSERVEGLRKAGSIKTFSDFRHGCCLDLIKGLSNASIDLAIMDAPYAIPDLDKTRGNTQYYTSVLKPTDNMTRTEVCNLMEKLCPELHRVMKPGAHIYMFFGWEVFEYTKDTLVDEGFDLGSTPIIWRKNKTTSPFKGYEPSPCYEQILFGHNGPRKKMLHEPMKNVLDFDVIPDAQRTHPFEKPSDLLSYLIKQSSNPGEVILDCFAGTGSTLRVASDLGRSAIGFEIDRDHWNKGQEMMHERSKK